MTNALADRRIVVGVDESAASAAAVRWAVREAWLRDATVHLVCACHYDPGMQAPYASQSAVTSRDERYASARAALAAAAKLVRNDLPQERMRAELADDLPVRALLHRAADAEMLVLGSTRPAREPGQPPLAVGPVARDCLRLAACPVVVVACGSNQEACPGASVLGRAGRQVVHIDDDWCHAQLGLPLGSAAGK